MANYKNIGYVSSESLNNEVVYNFISQYQLIDIKKSCDLKIDLLVVIGGDGFMLHVLHNYIIGQNVHVYGINYGTVGFLLNEFSEKSLLDRINQAIPKSLSLLKMEAIDIHGNKHNSVAVNEVSLFRNSHQAANLRIKINNKLKMEKLVGDGILVATPAGSTAYNSSAGGPILPLNSNVLSLTAINAFRPRRWRGALLPSDSLVEIEVLNADTRVVSAVSDYTEFHNIKKIKIYKNSDQDITLLFDPDHDLEERIIIEQFLF